MGIIRYFVSGHSVSEWVARKCVESLGLFYRAFASVGNSSRLALLTRGVIRSYVSLGTFIVVDRRIPDRLDATVIIQRIVGDRFRRLA